MRTRQFYNPEGLSVEKPNRSSVYNEGNSFRLYTSSSLLGSRALLQFELELSYRKHYREG